MSAKPVKIACVDDNEWIGESIRRVLHRREGLSWSGWFNSCRSFMADEQSRSAAGGGTDPLVVVLDLDIPGEDAFTTIATITRECPSARVLILSGYLGADLVDRALQAGAWGYISKNETPAAVVEVISRVASGEVALSPAVVEEYQRN
jgi:DNA-binding NarL/FixJ family response regulator